MNGHSASPSKKFTAPIAIIVIGIAVGIFLSMNQPKAPTGVGANGDPQMGDPKAQVTVIEYSDFQCPYCGRFHADTLPLIKQQYIDTGKILFVYRNFPLSNHPFAQKAAEAGECANEQGKFWEMHDAMFTDQQKLGVDDLKATAKTLGLNTTTFSTCLDTGKYADAVAADAEEGRTAGVDATPYFFVNGTAVRGAVPFDNFKTVLDQALAGGGA